MYLPVCRLADFKASNSYKGENEKVSEGPDVTQKRAKASRKTEKLGCDERGRGIAKKKTRVKILMAKGSLMFIV